MLPLLLLLSVPILFLIGRTRPERALLLWLFLSPLSYDTLVVFGVDLRVVTFDRLALLASALGLLANGRLGQLFPSRFSKLEKTMVVFILIFAIEAVVKFPPRDAFSRWTMGFDSFVVPFYLYLLLKYLLTREQRYNEGLEKRLGMTLALVGVYCAAMGIYEHITLLDLFPPPPSILAAREMESSLLVGKEIRVNGPFWVAEILGEYLSLILLFTLYRYRVGRVVNPASRAMAKVIKMPYALLLLVGMYFTMYRNVWGGFLGGYSSRYFFTRKGRKSFLLVLTILTLAAATIWGSFRQTEFYSDRLTNTDNIYDRLGAWLYAFRAFAEHPLMGIGYGRIDRYIRHAKEAGVDLRFQEDIEATYQPHNSVICLLAENGIFLTVPFLLLIGYFIGHVRACLRLAKSPADVEFGLFAVAGAFAMFAPHMTDRCLNWNKYNNLLFVLFALVAAHHAKLVRVVAPTAASVPLEDTPVPEIVRASPR